MQPREIKLLDTAKVLIVEDEGSQSRLLTKFIREAFSCDIVEAPDGLAALYYLMQGDEVPDLIVLDLVLPYVTGVEVLSIIRAREEFDDVPVVICTSISETHQIKGKIDQAIQGYLVKPITRQKVVEKILPTLHDFVFRVDYKS